MEEQRTTARNKFSCYILFDVALQETQGQKTDTMGRDFSCAVASNTAYYK